MQCQNLVKQLSACETMGCATTICTDKTGTLTTNKMTARSLYFFPRRFSPPQTTSSSSLGEFVLSSSPQPQPAPLNLLKACISVNTMDVSTEDKGNATESALLKLVHDLHGDFRQIRRSSLRDMPVAQQFVFTSDRKVMSWVVPMPIAIGGAKFRLFTKGAPEVIISSCSEILNADTDHVGAITQQDVEAIEENMLLNSNSCQRSIALAYRDFDEVPADWKAVDAENNNLVIESQLTFLCLVGIEDPLRPEVFGAIKKCYTAGQRAKRANVLFLLDLRFLFFCRFPVFFRFPTAWMKTRIRATTKLTIFSFFWLASLASPCSIKNAPRTFIARRRHRRSHGNR